jgi:hypothetical protein
VRRDGAQVDDGRGHRVIAARAEIDLSPAEGLRQGGIRKAMRIGLNRAASPVKAAVVSHADAVKRYGYLGKSIRIKLKGYPADRFVAVIGPSTKYTRTKGKYTRGKRKGEKRVFRPSKYAHLVEKGTGRSKPRPWLKPAYDESAGQFIDQAGVEVGREIELELARHQSRGTAT